MSNQRSDESDEAHAHDDWLTTVAGRPSRGRVMAARKRPKSRRRASLLVVALASGCVLSTEPVVPADGPTVPPDSAALDGADDDSATPDADIAADAAPCLLHTVDSVTASSDDGNLPANAIDGDLSTRWSAQGLGEWIAFDLGEQREVGRLAVAWHLGDTRVASFAIELSADSSSWSEVYAGTSSGTTLAPEPHDFAAQFARHVRLVCEGNDANTWNSIAEVEIYSRCD